MHGRLFFFLRDRYNLLNKQIELYSLYESDILNGQNIPVSKQNSESKWNVKRYKNEKSLYQKNEETNNHKHISSKLGGKYVCLCFLRHSCISLNSLMSLTNYGLRMEYINLFYFSDIVKEMVGFQAALQQKRYFEKQAQ